MLFWIIYLLFQNKKGSVLCWKCP